MQYLLDKTSFEHNIDSNFEGLYRIKGLEPNIDIEKYIDGESYLELVHEDVYIHKIKKACYERHNVAEIELTPESYRSACNAVGLTILAAERGDFAVVRPPGHHAFRGLASGFCLFNNIAIAAQDLVNKGKKVAIIDIDGHHGDGTQRIFYDTDEVFFSSIHQTGTFPGTGYDYEIGRGKGKGHTKNFPLEKRSNDRDFLHVLDRAIDEIQKFRPDVVGVSVGFDGYFKDKLLDLNFSLELYREAGKRLSQNFSSMFAVLEGGYHDDINECLEMFLNGVNNSE